VKSWIFGEHHPSPMDFCGKIRALRLRIPNVMGAAHRLSTSLAGYAITALICLKGPFLDDFMGILTAPKVTPPNMGV